MKLKFKQQQYQIDATNAVVNCFLGQTKWFRKETANRRVIDANIFGKKIETDEIFSNKKLELSDQEILQNVKTVQKANGLPQSNKLEWMNFTIEMETWTGKTYVYTQTIFELNQKYGWNKFIIMVPSIAIREWVYKSLQMTADHFFQLYWKKIRFFVYDTKNKSNLINIKNFANTSNIEVIILNYQAFATQSKESRKIYQELDVIQSQRPIDIIKRARPILIIDEPQKFWPQAEKKLTEFNPLFNLRYSATHKQEYNKIYRLDAIDAFNQKLVKKINVKWIEVVWNSGTNSYLFLDQINISKDSYPTAYIELEVKQKSWNIKKILKKFNQWDELFPISWELQQYKGFKISEINGKNNTVSFTNWVQLKVGQTVWDVDESHIRRIQIRETIRSHLEKERIMYHKWIKVLSLFFIDEVAKYRSYDNDWNLQKWEYEKIFEEEYTKALNEIWIFDTEFMEYAQKHPVDQIHNGYFSIDKKWRYVDSKEKKGQDWSDDESAYDLIMKDKEKLLSFSEPTRFIFSHSALREWWDNPNVFQICTLKHSQSYISKRQEIWRGLRICVNSNWERMDYSVLGEEFFDFNTLTVIASESYDDFAKQLQKEILESISNRPTKLTPDVFKQKTLINDEWQELVFDDQKSMDLIFDLKWKWYIDDNYKVTDKFIEDIEKNEFEAPSAFEGFETQLADMIKSIYNTDNFKVAENEKSKNVRKTILQPNENFAKKEFQQLWDKIKVKTTYEVNFDTDELIQKSIEAINKSLEVKKVMVKITEWDQKEEMDEMDLYEKTSMNRTNSQIQKTEHLLWDVRYDLVGEIAKWTTLTRNTVTKILSKIREDKFRQFKVNPEDFIRQTIDLIDQQKATTLINNIVYYKTNQTYDSDIFTINNFGGVLGEDIMEVKRHVYDYLKTDSKVETDFADRLETNDDILVYAKLPTWFKIPTPIGNYNPDWAVVFDRDDVRYIYFIVETKWDLNSLELKQKEKMKIEYAKKHFEALGHSDVKYGAVDSFDQLMNDVLR